MTITMYCSTCNALHFDVTPPDGWLACENCGMPEYYLTDSLPTPGAMMNKSRVYARESGFILYSGNHDKAGINLWKQSDDEQPYWLIVGWIDLLKEGKLQVGIAVPYDPETDSDARSLGEFLTLAEAVDCLWDFRYRLMTI